MISPTRHVSEEGKGLPFTCFDCVHFDLAHPSPNPNQAWGECRRLGKGRYGVARACDAFQKASQQDSLTTPAQEAGIEDIPVHYKSFESEYEALAYAIRLKRRCRKFTDAEIFRCIEALDYSAKLER